MPGGIVVQLTGKLVLAATVSGLLWCAAPGWAELPVIPGSGQRVPGVGDDYEDENWGYIFNNPKGNEENDGRTNPPFGRSRNGSMFETGHRGHPDVIQRVPTPPGGIPGSQGSLLLRTLQSRAPGVFDGQNGQDDLFVSFRGARQRFGAGVPVGAKPSITVRVYLPPFEQWERRNGASFGFRGDVHGEERPRPRGGLFGIARGKEPPNQFWPGIFIEFAPGSPDTARLRIRADQAGRDLVARTITADELGWWTFGMSFTGDGRVHYYAHRGVEDLDQTAYLASHINHGIKARTLSGMFFNLFNRNDGRSWSTPWVIDEPMLHVGGVSHSIPTQRPAPREGAAQSQVAPLFAGPPVRAQGDDKDVDGPPKPPPVVPRAPTAQAMRPAEPGSNRRGPQDDKPTSEPLLMPTESDPEPPSRPPQGGPSSRRKRS